MNIREALRCEWIFTFFSYSKVNLRLFRGGEISLIKGAREINKSLSVNLSIRSVFASAFPRSYLVIGSFFLRAAQPDELYQSFGCVDSVE